MSPRQIQRNDKRLFAIAGRLCPLEQRCGNKKKYAQICAILGHEATPTNRRIDPQLAAKDDEKLKGRGLKAAQARSLAGNVAELRPSHWTALLDLELGKSMRGWSRSTVFSFVSKAYYAGQRRSELPPLGAPGRPKDVPESLAPITAKDFLYEVYAGLSSSAKKTLTDSRLKPAAKAIQEGRPVSATERIEGATFRKMSLKRLKGVDARQQNIDDAILDARFERVVWQAWGASSRFIPVVARFLGEIGAPDDELARLNDLGQRWTPTTLGSFVELRADGIDAGWLLPGARDLAQAVTAVDESTDRMALTAWAAKAGVRECSEVRRSMAPPDPSTDLVIPLPGDDVGECLAAARDAFDTLEVEWLGDPVAEAIAVSESSDLALVVGLAATGLCTVGLAVPSPSLELTLILAGAIAGTRDEDLARWEGMLGATEVDRLVCSRRSDGLHVELHYVPGDGV